MPYSSKNQQTPTLKTWTVDYDILWPSISPDFQQLLVTLKLRHGHQGSWPQSQGLTWRLWLEVGTSLVWRTPCLRSHNVETCWDHIQANMAQKSSFQSDSCCTTIMKHKPKKRLFGLWIHPKNTCQSHFILGTSTIQNSPWCGFEVPVVSLHCFLNILYI